MQFYLKKIYLIEVICYIAPERAKFLPCIRDRCLYKWQCFYISSKYQMTLLFSFCFYCNFFFFFCK